MSEQVINITRTKQFKKQYLLFPSLCQLSFGSSPLGLRNVYRIHKKLEVKRINNH